jgi:hypothetical protein
MQEDALISAVFYLLSGICLLKQLYYLQMKHFSGLTVILYLCLYSNLDFSLSLFIIHMLLYNFLLMLLFLCTWNTARLLSFLFAPLDPFITFYFIFFPVSIVIVMLGNIGAGPCWVSSAWLPFSADCPLKDCCLLHLPICLSFYLHFYHCPISSKGNILSIAVLPCLPQQGYLKPRIVTSWSSPLLISYPPPQMCLQDFFSRFTLLIPSCFVKMFNRATSCSMWLFKTKYCKHTVHTTYMY